MRKFMNSKITLIGLMISILLMALFLPKAAVAAIGATLVISLPVLAVSALVSGFNKLIKGRGQRRHVGADFSGGGA